MFLKLMSLLRRDAPLSNSLAYVSMRPKFSTCLYGDDFLNMSLWRRSNFTNDDFDFRPQIKQNDDFSASNYD